MKRRVAYNLASGAYYVEGRGFVGTCFEDATRLDWSGVRKLQQQFPDQVGSSDPLRSGFECGCDKCCKKD